MDTAAVIKNLDLVICADTAVAHLAGALGVPVWLALPFVAEWRWLLDRDDSPWYPSARLYRQPEPGDWDTVFQRMAADLNRRLPSYRSRPITVMIAPGELIDKITILEIKSARITDEAKLIHVRRELSSLVAARDRSVLPSPELSELTGQLKAANAQLWQIEDDIRRCEQARDFGKRFVQLARLVYRTNDQRAALKRQINELLQSELVEEKDYAGSTSSARVKGH